MRQLLALPHEFFKIRKEFGKLLSHTENEILNSEQFKFLELAHWILRYCSLKNSKFVLFSPLAQKAIIGKAMDMQDLSFLIITTELLGVHKRNLVYYCFKACRVHWWHVKSSSSSCFVLTPQKHLKFLVFDFFFLKISASKSWF